MKSYYTSGERLQLVIDCVANGNQAEFASKTAIQASTLSRIRSGELPLSEQRIAVICAKYPQVSAQFLRDGVSYPGDLSAELVQDKLQKALAERDDLIATLRKEIELQQAIIAKLLK